jgi:hypothetical protein
MGKFLQVVSTGCPYVVRWPLFLGPVKHQGYDVIETVRDLVHDSVRWVRAYAREEHVGARSTVVKRLKR